MIHEPFQARCLRVLWRLFGRNNRLDQFLAGFLKYRKYLPECDAAEAIPGFSETEIRLRQCPLGNWSTPLVDVFIVLKAALGFRSRRILELGSYRGETARLLAENTGDDVGICTVNVDERHGAAYRGLDAARKIIRKTGRISPALFQPDEKYDLIFVDADHDFASVMNDTAVAFRVLAPNGVILWHDYRQDAYFHGHCGVPEALNEFANRHAVYAIRGTMLAIYSACPNWETATLPSRILSKPAASVWDERQVRG